MTPKQALGIVLQVVNQATLKVSDTRVVLQAVDVIAQAIDGDGEVFPEKTAENAEID